MKLENLLTEADEFEHILEIDGSIFLANDLTDLTGFCVPRLRHRGGGTWVFDYETGVAVLTAANNRERAFVEGIENENYVCHPRVIRVENTLDTTVRDGRITRLRMH